jgi:hypothetical protein
MQTKKMVYLLIILFIITLISTYIVQPAKAAAAFKAVDQTTLSDSGYVGDTVTLSGTGFPADMQLAVKSDVYELLRTNTDSSGSWTATYVISETKGGPYILGAWVIDDLGLPSITAVTPFTVLPSITLTPSSGPVGDSISVVGNGFYYYPVSDGLSATWDSSALSLSDLDSDGSYGNFIATFTVPSDIGTHTVSITSDADASIHASATFTVTTLSVAPEYPLGLLGLVACLVGFVLFGKRKGLHLNSRL